MFLVDLRRRNLLCILSVFIQERQSSEAGAANHAERQHAVAAASGTPAATTQVQNRHSQLFSGWPECTDGSRIKPKIICPCIATCAKKHASFGPSEPLDSNSRRKDAVELNFSASLSSSKILFCTVFLFMILSSLNLFTSFMWPNVCPAGLISHMLVCVWA